MAKLTIQRKGGFFYRWQLFKILIDGKEAATMRGKQTQEIELSNGNHRLRIIVPLWMSTQEISFDSTNPKIFLVSVAPLADFTFSFLLILLFKIILNGDYNVFQFERTNILFWIVFPPVLLSVLYFSTIGRKIFLIVKELSELNPSLL